MPDAALGKIVERYKAVESLCDAVVIVGSDYTDVGSPTELGYNARIAANLGAPVLLVLSGREGQIEKLGTSPARTPDEMGQLTALALAELTHGRASLLAVVANRADPERLVGDRHPNPVRRRCRARVPAAPLPTGRSRCGHCRKIGSWSHPPCAKSSAPSAEPSSRAMTTCSAGRCSGSSSGACRWSTCFLACSTAHW